MSRPFHMDDCEIQVPEGFKDRSVNLMEWQTEGGGNVILSISRDSLEGDFRTYVDRETRDLPSRYRGFKVERDDVIELQGGFVAARKAFRWNKEADVVYNQLAFVDVRPLLLLVTITAKARDRELADQLFDDVLRKFRIREL